MRGLERPEGQAVAGGADLPVEVSRRPGAHTVIAEELRCRGMLELQRWRGRIWSGASTVWAVGNPLAKKVRLGL
jgi:hypothetical protein